jgi:sodium-dependent dicarboxylate transporter 2/3/5
VLTRQLESRGAIELPRAGAWRASERRVLWVFGLTALAWVTRTEPFGGWTQLLAQALGQYPPKAGANFTPTIGDSTIALAAVVVLFVTPSGDAPSERLLDWRTAERVPWGLLLLFAGGMALAKAFKVSGLSALLGTALSGMSALPLWLLIVAIALSVSFLTEVTSNTATSAVLLPILAAAAIQIGLEPELLMVPAVLSASCAFMLPVATAPNAIVFSSGRISGRNMARTGVWLNLLGGLLVAALSYLLLT